MKNRNFPATYLRLLWSSEYRSIGILNSIFFVMQIEHVSCEVQIECLSIIQIDKTASVV
jgi:hypothetical protein